MEDVETLTSVPCPRLVDDKRCGTILYPTIKFCTECGGKIELGWFRRAPITAQPKSDDVYVCEGIDDDGTVCGKQVPIYTKFCANCGTRRKISGTCKYINLILY